MSAVYVDASALVKVFKREPETAAFAAALHDWDLHVSSELIVVEALCTARRLGPDAVQRAALAIDGLDLVPFTEPIRNRAAVTTFAPPLRALDAIHLATALALAGDLDGVLAYDADLCAAAGAVGLTVFSPA